MTRPLAAVLLAVLAGCGENVAVPEGVYTMCREVAGFSGETIELKGGKFRYWFYSDAGGGPSSRSGAYSISGNQVKFDDASLAKEPRTFAIVNGVAVLWRDDGLKLWESEQRIHPYAVLIRLEGTSAPPARGQLPSIELLKTSEVKEREKTHHEERFNDLPQELRSLMRAKTDRANRQPYKEEMARARAKPDPKLVSQLVSAMGRDSRISVEAAMTLEAVYAETYGYQGQPGWTQEAGSRKKALDALIDGIAAAPDRNALEGAVMVFLQSSGAGALRLGIPETPLQVRLEYRKDGTKVYGSEGTPVDDIEWHKFMPKVIPACQNWMREQLPK